MKVAFSAGIVVAAHTGLQTLLKTQVAMYDKRSTGLDETGVVGETLQIGRFRAVDVEVVGIGRGDDRGVRAEVMERAVELIGFNYHIVARFGKEIVRTIVFRNPSQKGVASHVALMEEVGGHGRCRRFAVRPRHAKSFLLACQYAQHFGTLPELKAFGLEPRHLAMVGRNGGGVDHQGVFGVAKCLGDALRVVLEVEVCALFAQGVGQGRRGAVVAAHVQTLLEKIALQSAHTDAAGTEEIDGCIGCHDLLRVRVVSSGVLQ